MKKLILIALMFIAPQLWGQEHRSILFIGDTFRFKIECMSIRVHELSEEKNAIQIDIEKPNISESDFMEKNKKSRRRL